MAKTKLYLTISGCITAVIAAIMQLYSVVSVSYKFTLMLSSVALLFLAAIQIADAAYSKDK